MMKPVPYLSSDFLISHGVPMTKPLRDWLNRASYLSKTRTSEADRRKYERWAVGVVENALREPGGIEGKDWTRISPVMPANAEDKEPTFLHNNGAMNQDVKSVPQLSIDHRSILFAECMKRSPTELRAFLLQAFSIMDAEVAAQRKRYDALTFMELIQVAQGLQRAHIEQMEKRRCNMSLAQVAVEATKTPELMQKKPPLGVKGGRMRAEGDNEKEKEKEKEKQSKRRRVDPSPQQGDYGAETTSGESERTCVFFRNLVSCSSFSSSSRPFVGESKELERMYSRYEPTAKDIRPRNVLVEALAFVLSKAKDKEKKEGSLHSAQYLNEQLKGMRQDLRVQNIVDSFAVEVYERHALICLELGDIGEFNQCQASLKKLYDEIPDTTGNSMSDFFCYRLAYLSLGGQYDALETELIAYTNTVAKGDKGGKQTSQRVKKSYVRWTLKLCTACEDGDCFTICRSLMILPRGMHLLLKIYLQKCRLKWLRELLNSVKGAVSMRFVLACLGFAPLKKHMDEDKAGNKENGCLFWLDGSFEEAEEAFQRFFDMIKFSLPQRFSFRDEIDRNMVKTHHEYISACEEGKGSTMIDAASLFKCADAYIAYLGTRRDARLDNVD